MNLMMQRMTLGVAAAALLAGAGCTKHAPASANSAPQPSAHTEAINGEDVVRLERTPTAGSSQPEFLSATVLPGRGMNLFQITANIPGKGEVSLFASPTIADAASKLNLTGADEYGNASFSFGGAFLVPYPNRIRGTLSTDGKAITTEWHGKQITLPANWKGKKPGAERHAMHGLILADKTEDVKTANTADGQTVTGTIHAGDFGGHWPSKTDLYISIALSGNAVQATITAKNIGTEEEPMAIGWHPYFRIPSGDRKQARLHIPALERALVNNYDDVFPTGKLEPVKGTKYDFNAPDGVPLDDIFLDDNFANLQRTGGAVTVDLVDPAYRYGIHVEGLSPEIKTVQVYAPPEKSFVAIEEQFNFGDPWGKEWHGRDTGMVTLKPGQSVTWQCRLQLFTPPRPSQQQPGQ